MIEDCLAQIDSQGYRLGCLIQSSRGHWHATLSSELGYVACEGPTCEACLLDGISKLSNPKKWAWLISREKMEKVKVDLRANLRGLLPKGEFKDMFKGRKF